MSLYSEEGRILIFFDTHWKEFWTYLMLRLGMTLFLLTCGVKQSYFVFQTVNNSLDPSVFHLFVHQDLHFAGMTRFPVDLLQIVCAAPFTRYV